jgi:hypothetical protein
VTGATVSTSLASESLLQGKLAPRWLFEPQAGPRAHVPGWLCRLADRCCLQRAERLQVWPDQLGPGRNGKPLPPASPASRITERAAKGRPAKLQWQRSTGDFCFSIGFVVEMNLVSAADPQACFDLRLF